MNIVNIIPGQPIPIADNTTINLSSGQYTLPALIKASNYTIQAAPNAVVSIIGSGTLTQVDSSASNVILGGLSFNGVGNSTAAIVDGGNNTTVSNCIFGTGLNDGILSLKANNPTYIQNTFYRTLGYNIYIEESSNCTIEGNSCNGSQQQHAIRGGGTNLQIIGNAVFQPFTGKNAIEINAGTGSVVKNRIGSNLLTPTVPVPPTDSQSGGVWIGPPGSIGNVTEFKLVDNYFLNTGISIRNPSTDLSIISNNWTTTMNGYSGPLISLSSDNGGITDCSICANIINDAREVASFIWVGSGSNNLIITDNQYLAPNVSTSGGKWERQGFIRLDDLTYNKVIITRNKVPSLGGTSGIVAWQGGNGLTLSQFNALFPGNIAL